MVSRWMIAGLLGLALAGPTFGQDSIPWQTDLRAAMEQAQREGKLVLVHFWSPECVPCMRLERNVFAQPAVSQAIAQNYVPVKINGEQNPQIADHFRVEGWPTDVILRPNGQEVQRSTSPQDPQVYVQFVGYVAQNAGVERPRFAGPSPERAMAPASFGANGQGATPEGPGFSGGLAGAGMHEPRAVGGGGAFGAPGGDIGRTANQTAGDPYARNEDPYASSGDPYARSSDPYRRDPGLYNKKPDRYPGGGSFAETGRGQTPAPPDSTNPFPAGTPTTNMPPNVAMTARGEGSPAMPAPAGAGDSSVIDNQFFRETGRGAADRSSDVERNFTRPDARDFAAGGTRSADAEVAGNAPSPGTPAAPSQKSLALDGFCPVTILEEMQWQPGDPRYGAIHRGRTYLFVSKALQQKFLADPDRYAPALAGNDPVAYFSGGDLVAGTRQFGVLHEDQVFLFSSAENRDRFEQNPGSYARGVMQAVRGGGDDTLRR